MGSAASTKVNCQSILPAPQECTPGPTPGPLRLTLRDHYLDNFDYKTEPEAAQHAQIQKKERCEVHPFSIPDLEDSDDELEMEGSPAQIRSESAIQKRKRCSVVPIEILDLMEDSDDEIDRILGELESKLEKPKQSTEVFLESF